MNIWSEILSVLPEGILLTIIGYFLKSHWQRVDAELCEHEKRDEARDKILSDMAKSMAVVTTRLERMEGDHSFERGNKQEQLDEAFSRLREVEKSLATIQGKL